ncbi:MAG: class I SAM-dependent methyltransferase [Candidatus Paceibacterota bacterium]
MDNLADKKYWDHVYKGQKANIVALGKKEEKPSWAIKSAITDFGGFLLWNIIFKRYLPIDEKIKIMEIGSAPGKYLIRFNKELKYEPYGVELSDTGYRLNVKNFEEAGLKTENVIKSDFTDQIFQKKYEEHFDVIYSRGFIEHFTDPSKAIDYHLALLKRGGFLVIIIPNLKGINYYLAKLTNPISFSKHNFNIMNYKKFKNLFDRRDLEPLCCRYFGVFNFGLFNADKKWKEFILLWLRRFQYLLNFVFFTLRKIDLESGLFSPYLIYIGKKK